MPRLVNKPYSTTSFSGEPEELGQRTSCLLPLGQVMMSGCGCASRVQKRTVSDVRPHVKGRQSAYILVNKLHIQELCSRHLIETGSLRPGGRQKPACEMQRACCWSQLGTAAEPLCRTSGLARLRNARLHLCCGRRRACSGPHSQEERSVCRVECSTAATGWDVPAATAEEVDDFRSSAPA